MDKEYTIIKSYGPRKFEIKEYDRKEFIREIAATVRKPKKVFLGLGDLLEVGDYNTMIDTVLMDEIGIKFENLIDLKNRKVSEKGDIPPSFFKLGVYLPDYLLKDVPTACVSVIGRKARLFPGAETFIRNIKSYDPVVMTAIPYEIAIEFIKRLDLDEHNLVSTKYKIFRNEHNFDVYAGDIVRFISGNRKSIEIQKYMSANGLKENEVVYIGRGEAGSSTFSTVNSIAFNPELSIISQSDINVYGSSLEALLPLFNFEGKLDRFLFSDPVEGLLPSLVVFSYGKKKSRQVIEIELEHKNMQNNIFGLRIEHSGESYESVEREINFSFTGSPINMNDVRQTVSQRMRGYIKKTDELIDQIYEISEERYHRLMRGE
jgi:hypothetical protein